MPETSACGAAAGLAPRHARCFAFRQPQHGGLMASGLGVSRRDFLRAAGAAGLGTVALPNELLAAYRFLAPVLVANPLAHYPNRDWEQQFRDVFRTDGSFVFPCAAHA